MDKHQERRKKINDEILRKMKNGESLASIDLANSWFPVRPKIKKDTKIIEKLYKKEDEDATDPSQEKPSDKE